MTQIIQSYSPEYLLSRHGKRSTNLRPTCKDDIKPNAESTCLSEQVKFVFSDNVGVMRCVYSLTYCDFKSNRSNCSLKMTADVKRLEY